MTGADGSAQLALPPGRHTLIARKDRPGCARSGKRWRSVEAAPCTSHACSSPRRRRAAAWARATSAADPARSRVTRDFGQAELASARVENVREGQTVLRVLQANFDVGTRFGGRFVDAIDGLESRGPDGQVDWFYFVNGVEAEVGAAEFELSPGDRVQWDRRDWRGDHARARHRRRVSRAVPQRAGGQAPPGAGGVRQSKSQPCRGARDDARARGSIDLGVITRRAGRGGGDPPGGGCAGLRRGSCEARPASSRARRRTGCSCAWLTTAAPSTSSTSAARWSAPCGPETAWAWCLRCAPLLEELVWLVTALDEEGLAGGVRALDEEAARRFRGRR